MIPIIPEELMHLQNRQACWPFLSFLKKDHTSLALSFFASLTWHCSWCCAQRGLCCPIHGVPWVWVTTWRVCRFGVMFARCPCSLSSSDWVGVGDVEWFSTDWWRGAWQIKMDVCGCGSWWLVFKPRLRPVKTDVSVCTGLNQFYTGLSGNILKLWIGNLVKILPTFKMSPRT